MGEVGDVGTGEVKGRLIVRVGVGIGVTAGRVMLRVGVGIGVTVGREGNEEGAGVGEVSSGAGVSDSGGGRLVIVMRTLHRSGNERRGEERRQKGEGSEQVKQPDGHGNRADVHSRPPFLARQIWGLFYHDPLACQSASRTGCVPKL